MNIELAKTKVIRKIDGDQLELLCRHVLTWLYGCFHQIPEMFDFEVSELAVLLKSYPDLKYDGIKQAFVDGMKTEYNRPCVANYAKWLEAYSLIENTNSYSEHDIVRARIAMAEEPTAAQKEKIAQEAYMWCLNHYQKTGRIEDAGNGIYNWLERTGKIALTIEQKNEIYKDAEQREFVRLERERKTASDKIDRKEVRKLDIEISSIVEGQPESVKVVARHIALSQYFDSLIEKKA